MRKIMLAFCQKLRYDENNNLEQVSRIIRTNSNFWRVQRTRDSTGAS